MAAGTGSGGGDVIAPRAFLCPITHDVMTQPCLLISPQLLSAPTYERVRKRLRVCLVTLLALLV